MNTRLLLTASALFLGLVGLFGSSVLDEILTAAGVPEGRWMKVLDRMTRVLYIGLAILNWADKDQAISSMDRRPILVTNFLVFVIGGIAILKGITGDPEVVTFWVLAVVYAGFAVGFGLVALRAGQA